MTFNKRSERRQLGEGRIIDVGHRSSDAGVQFPRESAYDCLAESVVVVYRLPLAALGHVIFSLAGHFLNPADSEGEVTSSTL